MKKQTLANGTAEQTSVLFVCLGNICRSPTGEAVFRSHTEGQGAAEMIAIDSAGTSGFHAGEPADRRMAAAGARRGYHLSSRSRQVVPEDFERFDLIVAMDQSNLQELKSVQPSDNSRAELQLMSSFLKPGSPIDIPDPYYGGDAGFEEVLDLIESGNEALLEYLLAIANR